MLIPMVLSIVIIGQTPAPIQYPAPTPYDAAPPPAIPFNTEKEKTTTLIVVGSRGSDYRVPEYLVMREKDGTITWSFICPIGFTGEGVDPEGEAKVTGTFQGDSKLLTRAFRATLGEITEKKPPKRDKDQRVPADFSLILINSEGVKTCELWSIKQRMRLVHGGELKGLFSEVRKEVFGVGLPMSDLLQAGKNPNLGEPRVPVKEGGIPPLPKSETPSKPPFTVPMVPEQEGLPPQLPPSPGKK